MRYLLGVDIGTTGARAVLVDEEGRLVAGAVSEYPMFVPKPGWTEQEPEDWWRATKEVVGRALREAKISGREVTAVGFTGQMHGLVTLDEGGRVLRRCIMWNDQRTARQCEEIEGIVGRDRLVELTCNPVLTGFTAPKLLWVKENEPEVFERIAHILLPKDYVRFRLTGEYVMDVADASGTSMFDVKRREWAWEIIDALGFDRRWFPPTAESPEVVARVSKVGAEETGLVEGTPVVAGAGDQAAGGVGAGAVEEGIVSVNLGTSGVVFAHLEEPRVDPGLRTHTFCHAVPGKWHVMGVMLAAGGSLRWFRDALCGEERLVAEHTGKDPYEFITEEAALVPAGSEGLLFLPYLSGERTPHADPFARGVFFGLSLKHTKAHMARAVLEGVAFGLRDSLEILKSMGLSFKEIRFTGGGSRSDLWRQILADIFNFPVTRINIEEGTAFGAALLAGVGAGIFGSVEEACRTAVKGVATSEPNHERAKIYEELYRLYGRLYESLKERFREIPA